MQIRERWRGIPGYGDRYEISDLGRVKSLPFMQRYLLRNGNEAFRLTKEKIRKLKKNNSGYLMLDLWLDGIGQTFLVHRLVAVVFVPGDGETVNHKDGKKANNAAVNLEWCSYTGNHLHAVGLGLNTQALAVVDPRDGKVYPSINQAARGARVAHRTAARWARP